MSLHRLERVPILAAASSFAWTSREESSLENKAFIGQTTVPSAPPAAWWSGSLPRHATLGAGALCGALIGLGCSGRSPWFVSMAALTLFAWIVRRAAGERRLREGYNGGADLQFGLGILAMQLAGGWWIALGVNPRGDALPWQFLVVASTMLLQTFWLAAAWAVARRCVVGLPGAGAGLAWCVAWGAGEALRELGPTGYGYTSLGTAFLDTPGFSGWPAVTGIHGASMLMAALAWLLAELVRSFRLSGARPAGARAKAGIALLATFAFVAAGHALSAVEWTRPDGPKTPVAVIQDATDKRQPWSVAQRDVAEDRLLDAVRGLPRGGVVVTPEGHFADPLPTHPERFWELLRREVGDGGTHVLVGMPQRALDGDQHQVLNAIVQVAPERIGLYAKERLVPGGESLPMVSVFSALYEGAFQGNDGNARIGEQPAPPELAQPLYVAGAFVGASICHELSFTTTMAQRARGSAWLLNAAEDAWIPSAAYRSQMVVIARTRALELGKPLLRVSDGGESILVDARGHVEQRAPTTAAVTLRWLVQPHAGATPYERHARALSLAPTAALAALVVAAMAMRLRRRLHPAPTLP
jgi:apolipoprotein N-acyltransferase